MGTLLISLHLNGTTNVLVDAASSHEAQQLEAVRNALEAELAKLRVRVMELAGTSEDPRLAERRDTPAAKLGRPKGAATGFDMGTKLRITREALRLRTQGITWEGIHARTGVSPDTLRRWIRELSDQ